MVSAAIFGRAPSPLAETALRWALADVVMVRGQSNLYARPVAKVTTMIGATPLLGDLDAERIIARVPSNATCKGMYFSDLLPILRKTGFAGDTHIAELAAKRYVPFRDYPLVDHMRMTSLASRLLFPDCCTREAMRRFGWKAFPAFVQSLIGRIVFRTLGPDLDQIFGAGPKSFEVSLSHGRATATRLGDAHWRYEFHEMYGFLDTYYVGVIEGPIRKYRFTPEMTLALEDSSNGTMTIRWH
jgi:uncharacterized protein (TIGR02265 family)